MFVSSEQVLKLSHLVRREYITTVLIHIYIFHALCCLLQCHVYATLEYLNGWF